MQFLDEFFPTNSLAIEAMVNDFKSQDFLYINTLYNNKTLFSGRDFGVEQYSSFPAISYIDSNNFFLNVGSGFYSEINPQWDFVTFNGGYSNYLNKKNNYGNGYVFIYYLYKRCCGSEQSTCFIELELSN